MSNSNQSSYRQIMKATSIFGGVQFYQIVLTIVRTKIVAVLLGTAGMGISGLFTAATTLITGITSLGLNVSAVKNVSEANATGDMNRVALVTSALRRLVWITGLLGTGVVIVLSPWLSEITFGNGDYTLGFVWLSVTLLFSTLSNGQYVLLQGLRKVAYLAKANVAGATIGLIVSLPVYYYYGMDGIVPALVLSSLAAMLLAYYFGNKVKVAPVPLDTATLFKEGRDMVKMGVLLSLSTVVAMAASYVTRIYISNTGGVEDVGLFNAGFAIVNTYVGMIFTAMSTDYYPRLSAVAHDAKQARTLINQQAEIALLILGPILAIFLIFIKFAIILLYSYQFVAAIGMVQWIVLAILLKAVSWAMGFMLMAKGASKVFFYNELITNAYTLVLNIVGYFLFGLEGLGISFFVAFIVALIQNFLILRVKYGFAFDAGFYKIFMIQLILAVGCFILVRSLEGTILYIASLPLLGFAVFYSYKEMNSRMDLSGIVKRKLSRS